MHKAWSEDAEDCERIFPPQGKTTMSFFLRVIFHFTYYLIVAVQVRLWTANLLWFAWHLLHWGCLQCSYHPLCKWVGQFQTEVNYSTSIFQFSLWWMAMLLRSRCENVGSHVERLWQFQVHSSQALGQNLKLFHEGSCYCSITIQR